MITISGYRIERTLGQGGMATVYLAIQESFEREVALKILSGDLAADESFSERFIREAKIVSRLVHPNIVTVYDVGVEEGHHFLSMEYIPGDDLKQGRYALTLSQCLSVIKDIARALSYAGKKGYVHRDVKPENIMLHGEDGRAVLMDFGIARPSEQVSSMTQTGTAIGTPHYMSPEQARGQTVDPRSDLYSLGVVMFLLLTGHVPFDADSAVAVGVKHVSEPIPRLPDYLNVFQPIINAVLSKDPEHRYQTGDELIAALDEIPAATIAEIEAFQAQQVHLPYEADETAETIVSQTAISVAPMGAVAEPSVTQLSQEVEISLSREDRVAESEEVHEHTSSAWPWVAALFLAGAVGLGVFYQQQLPAGYRIDGLLESFTNTRPTEADIQGQASIDNKPVTTEAMEQIANSETVPHEVADNEVQPPTVIETAKAVDAAEAIDGNETILPVEPQTMTAVSVDVVVGGKPEGALVNNQESVIHWDEEGVSTASIEEDELSAVPEFGQDRDGQIAHAQYLMEQIQTDRIQAEELAPQAAQIYRQLLGRNPTDVEARQGLRQLREGFQSEARRAMEAQDFDAVERQIELAAKTFPNAAVDQKLQRLQKKVEVQRQVQSLLTTAQQRLDENKLTTPVGESAADTFKQILTLEPDHPKGNRGLQDIAQRYSVLGQSHLKSGNSAKALIMIERGLGVLPQHKELLSLQKQAQQSQRVEQRLVDAQALAEQEQLLEPANKNALAVYREVLAIDSANKTAKAGVESIEDALVAAVESRIAGGDYDGASGEINRALLYFPDSQTLRELQAINEQAIADLIEASRPKISRVLVSAKALDTLNNLQETALAVDRIIHVGFHFENFESATSVVQAVLFDGARQLQIAQVPVIVSGQSGEQFFRIERPVEGFADGGYNIDLLLENQRLSSASFQVNNTQDL